MTMKRERVRERESQRRGGRERKNKQICVSYEKALEHIFNFIQIVDNSWPMLTITASTRPSPQNQVFHFDNARIEQL